MQLLEALKNYKTKLEESLEECSGIKMGCVAEEISIRMQLKLDIQQYKSWANIKLVNAYVLNIFCEFSLVMLPRWLTL
jgi:hypothetical protein